MKIIITTIASMLFSTLFYDQHIGLNLTVFSLVTLVVLGISNPSKLRMKETLTVMGLYLLTAILVFFNHSSLSIIANCAVFFTLVGSFSESTSSVYVKWLNGIYSSIAGTFHRNFENKSENKKPWNEDVDVLHLVKIIVIPLVVVILFVLLYKDGNPFFDSIVSAINFDFINFQWVLFCLLGYYLFSNIIVPVKVQPATDSDLATENQLKPFEPLNEDKLKKEKQLGTVLLALLNTLIVLYIISDIAFLLSNTNFAASVLSNQVHNGINALIASIIFAIIIILYFFRGNLNFFDDNKTLKNLSYLWIFLNAFLVLLIIVKNAQYIDAFGLTYKRIGVYVYLFMTFIGLTTTFLKVYQIKNLWFLFRRNVSVAFMLLVLCSVVNWDAFITNYNIKNADSLDVNYLIELSNNNAFILHQKKDRMVLKSNQGARIDLKYSNYVSALEQSNWQEWSYDNLKIKTDIKSYEDTK
ncbi:MAG: DUF4173 domain-containing protein [Gelidibacter sp.]